MARKARSTSTCLGNEEVPKESMPAKVNRTPSVVQEDAEITLEEVRKALPEEANQCANSAYCDSA